MGDINLSRDIKFDIARCLCMIYVIAIFHLSQYLGNGQDFYLNNTNLGSCFVCSALGVFSLVSGYFIGLKYDFKKLADVWIFYKKRLVRFYPLFFIAATSLWIIDFNTLGETISALVGVACFVPEELRPSTLWYISMLMIFYLLTPTIVGGGIIRLKVMLVWMLAFLVYRKFFDIDVRLLFNYVMYCAGIIISRKYHSLALKFLLNRKWLVCSIFLYVLVAVTMSLNYMSLLYYGLSIIGVWMLLSLSFYLERFASNKIFKDIVEYVSYASMCLYMFHRLFYYFAMKVITFDSVIWTLAYLVLFAFPVGLFLSYEIQKYYDKCVKKIG